MVVPAPHGTICPLCQKVVSTGKTDIVRFNGKIFHESGCFALYTTGKRRNASGHALMLGTGVYLERKETVAEVLAQAQDLLSKIPNLRVEDLYVLNRASKVTMPVTHYARVVGA